MAFVGEKGVDIAAHSHHVINSISHGGTRISGSCSTGMTWMR